MSGRVLVVDDEPQIRRVMRTLLVSHNYQVDEARSGEEAVDAVRKVRFDLVLLDSNMPGMGGPAACQELRAISEVAIVMLTVRNDEAHKIAALDAGADDYVTKPFSAPELMARIRAALRRVPADTEPRTLQLGQVEIDLGSRRVRSPAGEVRLTPKEFDLLQFFVTNPNIALPHGRLLQAVWGPDYGGEVEYLRVFMNQLRKKIEANPARPRYLLTEPWVGYRLRLPAST